jgi:hypothetical protein
MELNRRLEYSYQKRYRPCGHTIHSFGWGNESRDAQFRAGGPVLVYFEEKCEDCKARQNIGDSNINFLLTALRTQIDGYVRRMHEFSISIRSKNTEIQKVRQQSLEHRTAWTRALSTEKKQAAELQTLRQEKKHYEAENVKLRKTISQQGQELGTLRKKIKEFEESPAKDELVVQNANLQAPGPLQQSPTENSLTTQRTSPQETAREKKFKLVATMGYINPIASGFNTLKHRLEEHVWWPFVKSLLSELQEAVRRNNWEEICDIHDRVQSFAVAFDNDLKERVEKAEQEIVKQCEEGVQRLLKAMM